MKIALCFSGMIRTFRECYPSYERIFSKYDCDTFVATTPNDTLKEYSFTKVALEEDVWINEKAYNECKNGETIVQNTLRQFYFIRLANELRRAHELKTGIKYDFIVRTRLDNIMVADIPDLSQCDPNKIYIPSGHDHPNSIPGAGINDRFAFGGDRAMNIYCDKIYRIDEYMNEGRRFHPETILKWSLDTAGLAIERFPECSKINRGNNELL